MSNFLWKPNSESNGNLVILTNNTTGLSLVDLATGEVVEEGNNTGASNGRGATVRFQNSGSAYQNVAVVDSSGNVVAKIGDGSARVEFDYDDYNSLVAEPPSTSYLEQIQEQEQAEADFLASQEPSTSDQAMGIAAPIGQTYVAGKLVGTGATAGATTGATAGATAAGSGGVGGAAGVGAGAILAAVAGAGVMGNQVYEDGGKDIISGDGKTDDYHNMYQYISNPETALGGGLSKATGLSKDEVDTGVRVGQALMTGGLSEVARFAIGDRKSTKEYQANRRGEVVDDGNALWADYYDQNELGKHDDHEVDWTLSDGNWDAREYATVQGNADTFGDDWFQLSEDQRNEAVRRFNDENLYHDNKGNKLIADDKQDRAREIFGEVTSEGYTPQYTSQIPLQNEIPSVPVEPEPASMVLDSGAENRSAIRSAITPTVTAGQDLANLEAVQLQKKMAKQQMAMSMLSQDSGLSGQLLTPYLQDTTQGQQQPQGQDFNALASVLGG